MAPLAVNSSRAALLQRIVELRPMHFDSRFSSRKNSKLFGASLLKQGQLPATCDRFNADRSVIALVNLASQINYILRIPIGSSP
jgi:hypothetical protein